MKTAKIGSISTGTLRTEDLLSTLSSTLEGLILINGDHFSQPENFSERDRLNKLVGDAGDCFGDDGETLTEDGEESGPEIVDELIEALQVFAPSFCTFGAHIGDGADFGFWPDIDSARDGVEFVSSKRQEWPADDFRGEWLHINDHGNATLYVRESVPSDSVGGVAPRAVVNDRELWSVV